MSGASSFEDVQIRFGITPIGPFTLQATYSLPEEIGNEFPAYGDNGSYDSCTLMSYTVAEHPELETNGDIVIGYSVNGSALSDCSNDPNLANYQPKFISVAVN